MPQALIVPDRFSKNAPGVRAMGTPAETGTMLIEYMCERLGVADLRALDVLDFGCGVRFADAILNKRLLIKSYTGIDVDREAIEFLSSNVTDPRFAFYYWNARNPSYNPTGFPLTPATSLPTSDRQFDLICMFSVITHQVPNDAEALFSIFRRCVRSEGRMFFSAIIQEMEDDYRELVPDQPTGASAYSWECLRRLLERSGWLVLSREGRNPRGLPILNSLLCAPAAAWSVISPVSWAAETTSPKSESAVPADVIVDAEWYLSQYLDVRAAIQDGSFKSALDHYRAHGYFEKRLPSKPVVDEAWYLQTYPDVAQAIREGREMSAYDHFVKYGHREGRIPSPPDMKR